MSGGGAIARSAARLHGEIAEACVRGGRAADAARLMAVSKFQSPEAVREAREAGLTLFGESRVQEAEQKFAARAAFDRPCELHMIGSLQRNKAKAACALFDCVQSVDRPELIAVLGKYAAFRPRPLDILFEMNSGEVSKGGYRDAENLFAACEAAFVLPSLRVRGLMTMAPFTGDKAAVRAAFTSLARMRDALAARFGEEHFTELSMGMSGDFTIAAEEGATIVRIGTALFGERGT